LKAKVLARALKSPSIPLCKGGGTSLFLDLRYIGRKYALLKLDLAPSFVKEGWGGFSMVWH
jgi:hypothetical protein